MSIKIFTDHVTLEEIKQIADATFGDMAKAVVDIERHVMAVGGELHADAEALLLDQGSKQSNLWGINLYPDQPKDQWIEFDSMINIRPQQGNRSRDVENAAIRQSIRSLVQKLTD